MARWKLTIQYDGSDFLGWQRQKIGRTVQGELETALESFLRQPVKVMGQGRTDKGVHAVGQIAHADLPESTERQQLLSAMRGLLPFDMAVTDARIADEGFHARFDAKSRIYKYNIASLPSPLYRHMCWLYTKELVAGMLYDCAEHLIGEHDFRNFARESLDEEDSYKTTICTVTRSEWLEDGKFLIYTIEGNRFLRHMVRRLVGTMVQVSAGKLEPDAFKKMLTGDHVPRKGHAAPAKGLILERVDY